MLNYKNQIAVNLRIQLGVFLDHCRFSWHVLKFPVLSEDIYPSSHLIITVAPAISDDPITRPFFGDGKIEQCDAIMNNNYLRLTSGISRIKFPIKVL